MSSPVRVSIGGDIAHVELDKPPVNAFDLVLVEALRAGVSEVRASEARAAVFSGRGPTLAAGGDIKFVYTHTTQRDAETLGAFFSGIQATFLELEELPIPTVAAIHGPTLGGGFELALACDFRVMADDAQIGFPEGGIGLLPGAGGTQRLTELVGRARALELMLTGRRLDAEEAHRLGVVNRVAPADRLAEETEAFVGELLRSTRAAAAAIKRCVAGGIGDGRATGFRLEQELVRTLAFDPDSVERLTSFVTKRQSAAAGRRPDTT